jgi:RimJ/RimL family protein N-acetyltransferase
VIATERLQLRRFTWDDLDEFSALLADPDVARYLGTGQPYPRQKVAERMRFYLSCYDSVGYGMCGAALRGSTPLVGWSGLQPLDDSGEIELGYGFAKPYWGQGLATEVARTWIDYGFHQIGLSRIVAVADPANAASRRVMEKVGLRYERLAHHHGAEVVLYAIHAPSGRGQRLSVVSAGESSSERPDDPHGADSDDEQ